MQHNEFHEAGYRVFGLHGFTDKTCDCDNPECQAPGKHPILSSWQNVPVWSDDQWDVMEAMGHFKTGYGVLCRGLIVVDVDARNGGVASYERLLERCPEIASAGLIVETGSGGGSKHLYFTAPDDVALLAHLRDYPGVDFRSGNSFVVGPGSAHVSGRNYLAVVGTPDDIEEAPAGLVELLRRPAVTRVEYDGRAMDVSHEDVASMLAHIPCPDEYHDWINVGMAVHHSTNGSGFEIWDRWSQTGNGYDPDQMQAKWHSFGKHPVPVTVGTLIHKAEQNGWLRPVGDMPEPEAREPHDGMPVDTSGIDLRRPPGFVGKVAEWIAAQPRRKRDNLAVGAALVAVGNHIGLRMIDGRDGITGNMVAFGVAGSGCHAKDAEIMMHDATVKKVQDVAVGDVLMGPYGLPKTVLRLARGRQQMAVVKPIKGDSYVVNLDHIMNLQRTGSKRTINITVRDWIASSAKFKSKWKLRRSIFEARQADVPISPYVLGLMLGDGCLVGKVMITSMDHEIHDACDVEFGKYAGCEKRFYQVEGNKSWHTIYSYGKIGKSKRPLIDVFKSLGLWGCGAADKFIPQAYKQGSIDQRLQLLAGIMDTDGHTTMGGYDYITKSPALAYDVQFIARSVGLAANVKECRKSSQTGHTGTYYRVSISGDCTIVPVRLPHKVASVRRINKDPLVTGFSVEVLPEDDFYGFAISGDHLYMTSDFIVHHNTGKEAVQQAFAELHRRTGISGAVHGAIKSDREIYKNLMRHQAAFYNVDEISDFLEKLNNAKKKGGASYLDSVVATIMSVFTKANGYLLLTGDEKEALKEGILKEAATEQRKLDDGRGSEEQLARLLAQADEIDKGLKHPFLSMCGYGTPAKFHDLMDFRSATEGFFGRAMVFEEKDSSPRVRKNYTKVELPQEIVDTLEQLYYGTDFDVTKRRVEYTGDRIKVPTDDAASEMLDAISEWMDEKAIQQSGTTGLEALFLRGYELVSKVSFILAAPHGLRTCEHVRWAFALVVRDLELKAMLTEANDSKRDAPARALQSKVMAMLDKDDWVSLGVMRNKCRGYKNEDIEAMLKKLVDAGHVMCEEVTHPVNGRVSLKYRRSE